MGFDEYHIKDEDDCGIFAVGLVMFISAMVVMVLLVAL